MELGLIIAVRLKERPIRSWHLALVTRQGSENRPNTDQASQGGLGSTWLRGQVDTPVDTVSTWQSTRVTQVGYPVDLGSPRSTTKSTWVPWAGIFPPWPIGPDFEFPIGFSELFWSVWILNWILKLPEAISSSYGVRFTQTRTLSQAEFRDERNGVSRFP